MIEIKGTFNTAICHTNAMEELAKQQIKHLCDLNEFKDSKICVMPDVHPGSGCVVGLTMTIKDKVIPNMVGVDIGCGMETVKIEERKIDFDALDKLIYEKIPAGGNIRDKALDLNDEIDLTSLRSFKKINIDRAKKSLGTLGGGNHFIEIDKNDKGELYIVVHSGSRHIGLEIANLYQKEALSSLMGHPKKFIDETIAQLKSEGRQKEISETLKKLHESNLDSRVPKEYSYVTGTAFDDYIFDMKLIQKFAILNRLAMTEVILKGLGLTEIDRFTTVHNYIDTENMILRKGSVSAKEGERLIIPINMRDGSFICIGKGNYDWNLSAPHGAGRILGRKEAKKTLSVEKYIEEMRQIHSTSVCFDTLDESPMVYKPIEEIVSHIGSTVDIVERLTTVYNFKATE